MSLYIKIFIFAVITLTFPKFVEAKATTLEFEDNNWEIVPITTSGSQTTFTRNQFSLKNLANHILLNKKFTTPIIILDNESLAVISAINEKLNRPVTSAKLKIENGWATEFIPHRNGQGVDNYKLVKSLTSKFESTTIPLFVSEPQTKLSDLNNMGINELIARGESDFTGSSRNRITNVSVGSSKYNGLILQPGQEFSFNSYLGDVDAAHGFKPEQVIKASGIELEFGGGLCQVSTTMFRAAMNAGFPIVQRRNHSFAVKYYAPQGTDATIYPGVVDLKFTNNYETPVIVHTYIQEPRVYFEIYGTKDNRIVSFEGPVQYDKKPNGAMKASWTRHVTLKGQTYDYVATSNYVSPNLYKKVEVVSTPNPETQATPANTPVKDTSATTNAIPDSSST